MRGCLVYWNKYVVFSCEYQRRERPFYCARWYSWCKKEDIDISLEQHVLTWKGEHHFEKSEEGNGYTRRERAQGQFYHRFSLPQTTDDSKNTARYAREVLEISIPKRSSYWEKIAITLEEWLFEQRRFGKVRCFMIEHLWMIK